MRLGLGLGLSRGSGGGSGLLSMNLGVNINAPNTYQGNVLFSNLMYQTGKWEQWVGSGAFTQSRGSIVATVSTDEFRATIAPNGEGLPSGTYTVLNPSGAQIGIGGYTAQNLAAYTTATSFTFTYTAGTGLFVHCKGSLPTTSGYLAIILPGQLTAWQSGNPWNSSYLSFIQGTGVKTLRMMNCNNASSNIEVDWADRTDTNGINFATPFTGGGPSIPWELMIDLANRLGVDPWLCLPTRCTSDYVTQFATLVNAQLNASRRLYIEHSNEVWNYGYPWGDGTVWIQYLDHTRRIATANPTPDTYTLTAHGITNGAEIRSFMTKENVLALASDTTTDYRTRHGSAAILEVIDANTFRLRDGSLGGAIIPVVDNQVNLHFVVTGEAGKTADLNGHYAELLIRDWDILDSLIGASRIEHIVAGQAVTTSIASARLTAPVAARTDSVSPAPYLDHTFWGCAVDISTGQLLPKFFSSRNTTVHIGIYASGSTPSIADVIAGTGAINKQSFASNYVAGAYTNGTAVTGLTNGTTYSVQIVVIDIDGTKWAFSGNATVSASTSTVNITDTYAQQAARGRAAAKISASYVANHKALGKPVICYEGASHDNQVAPAAVSTWFFGGYMESAEYGAVLTHYLKSLAAEGAKGFFYYSDILSGATPFKLADGFADTTDQKYVAFSALAGKASAAALSLPDIAPADVAIDPVTYPYTVATFANASLTYSIFNGNDNGNFAIVGNQLRMVNGTGVNWAVPTARALTIEASNGAVSDFFVANFATGNAWYASDAVFAWDSIGDANNTQIDPVVGAVIPRVTGTGATIAGGLWDMDTNVYRDTGSVLTSALNSTRPILVAAVLDKDNHSTGFVSLMQVGGVNFIRFSVSGGIQPRFDWNTGSTGNIRCSEAALAAGAKVYWAFYDPATTQLRGGINQTENTTHGPVTFTYTADSGRGITIGGQDATARSAMKHGSMQVVNRAGMTLSDALAIVQKMQTFHGI